MNLSSHEKELIRQNIQHEHAQSLRESRRRMSIYDFEPITIIGKGAFGEVRLVRSKLSGELIGMKRMNKSEMIRKNQVHHVLAERSILAAADNPWIVELKYSFQDEHCLYLAMEYLAGGDLMSILMKKDIFSEDEARFYMAESILATHSVHSMSYIHRDLKPDNILIDASGHVKLTDFGLCKYSEVPAAKPYANLRKLHSGTKRRTHGDRKAEFKRSRKLAYSTVGTPDYIAPEVFGKQGYNESIDWWSLGAIFYEMVVGYPPFYADDPSATCQKILNWRKTLSIPKEANLSREAADLVLSLLADPADRLGSNGVEEIKAHPFFHGVDWNNLRKKRAPWVPQLASEIDTCNFDEFEETQPFYPEGKRPQQRKKDLNFIGFTYKWNEPDERVNLAEALRKLETVKSSQARLPGYISKAKHRTSK